MAINWESIEGYTEGMSADEKLALLDRQDSGIASTPAKEVAAQVAEEEKPQTAVTDKTIAKSQFDKLASELAATKKQLRAKLSEDEAKELDRKQAQESMEQELAALRKEKTLSVHKASFLSLGYEEQLAHETAEALVENDMDAVFSNMKKHKVNLEKAIRAEILKDTPVPPSGYNVEKKDEDVFVEAFKNG